MIQPSSDKFKSVAEYTEAKVAENNPGCIIPAIGDAPAAEVHTPTDMRIKQQAARDMTQTNGFHEFRDKK